jgi:cation transport ATPase
MGTAGAALTSESANVVLLSADPRELPCAIKLALFVM